MHQNTKSDASPVRNAVAGQKNNIVEKTEKLSESSLPIVSFNPNAASYQSDTASKEIPRGDMANRNGASKQTPPVDQQIDALAKTEMKSDGSETSENVKSSPGLMIKCKNIVDRAMQKQAELTRSSFEAVVLGLLSTQQNESKSMANSLEKQRLEYDDIIVALRAQNTQLAVQCDVLNTQNATLIDQNSELNAAKTETEKLKAELENANGKLVSLHNKLNEMVNHNGALSARVSKLQKLNVEHSALQKILHQKLEQSMSGLQTVTKELASSGREIHEKCAELKTKFDGFNDDKTSELNQMRQLIESQKRQMAHMKKTFDQVKNDAIAETKKLQWCQGCGNPGDPFYCNRCRYERMQRYQMQHFATTQSRTSSENKCLFSFFSELRNIHSTDRDERCLPIVRTF